MAQRRAFRSDELLANPALFESGIVDLDEVYSAYRVWMKRNDFKVIKRLANKEILCHYSDSLLLAGGYEDNYECMLVLRDNDVKFDTMKCDKWGLVLIRMELEALEAAEAEAAELDATEALAVIKAKVGCSDGVEEAKVACSEVDDI